MSDPPKRTSGVDYRAPGSEQWQAVRSDLRLRARELLARADREVRRVRRLHLRREGELLAFERGMAAALGAWDRWVEAGARQLLHRGKRAEEEDAWEAVKKAFQIQDDDE